MRIDNPRIQGQMEMHSEDSGVELSGSFSGSFQGDGSQLTGIQTASFALNADGSGFPFSGSAEITGSLNVTNRFTLPAISFSELPAEKQTGDIFYITDTNELVFFDGTNLTKLPRELATQVFVADSINTSISAFDSSGFKSFIYANSAEIGIQINNGISIATGSVERDVQSVTANINLFDSDLILLGEYLTLSSSPETSVDEGSSVTFTLVSSRIVDGTTVGYTITGVDSSDIDGEPLTGIFTISSNTDSVTFNITADQSTEGSETLTLTLDSTDSNGATTGELSDTVNINDTSTTPPLNVEYLVIAGGGGGGGALSADGAGGGGGAGGYRSSVSGESSGGGASAESSLTLSSSTNYSVSIGAGGSGGSGGNGRGSNGGASSFYTVSTAGGGGGGNGGQQSNSGASGGSGGGADGWLLSGSSGGSGTTNQGFSGGSRGGGNTSGGGGGAGSAGETPSEPPAGDGGSGVTSSITGSAVTRAGGGGGGTNQQNSGAGAASDGGGSGGSLGSGGTNGTANTGGGGGGCGKNTSTGASGGSGVVILRYPSAYSINAGAGLTSSTTTVGPNKVTTFTAGSDTISFS